MEGELSRKGQSFRSTFFGLFYFIFSPRPYKENVVKVFMSVRVEFCAVEVSRFENWMRRFFSSRDQCYGRVVRVFQFIIFFLVACWNFYGELSRSRKLNPFIGLFVIQFFFIIIVVDVRNVYCRTILFWFRWKLGCFLLLPVSNWRGEGNFQSRI